MADFVPIQDDFWVSRQITLEDVDRAASEGIKVIICNRPDDEQPDQLNAGKVAARAREKGLEFFHVPMVSGNLLPENVEGMHAALPTESGRVLAYCMSGTRSTILWGLVQVGRGDMTPQAVKQAAAKKGYDLEALTPMLDMMIERGV